MSLLYAMSVANQVNLCPKQTFFRSGTQLDPISISFLTLLLMLPDRGEAHVIAVTANALVIMWQIFQSYQAIRALPPSIIIEEAFNKGIEAEDGLITLAKKSCLSLNEVKIWVGHLQKKRESRIKAVQKAKETRARKKQIHS